MTAPEPVRVASITTLPQIVVYRYGKPEGCRDGCWPVFEKSIRASQARIRSEENKGLRASTSFTWTYIRLAPWRAFQPPRRSLEGSLRPKGHRR